MRVFLNVNEQDNRASDPESTFHNWVMANERTGAALAAKGCHYRYVSVLEQTTASRASNKRLSRTR